MCTYIYLKVIQNAKNIHRLCRRDFLVGKGHNITESNRRLYEKLRHDLGEEILSFLEDTDIKEIMLNPG